MNLIIWLSNFERIELDKLHNLRQGDLPVKNYIAKFEDPVIVM